MNNKQSLIKAIEQLNISTNEGKEFAHILGFITSLMVDAQSKRFGGAALSKEFQTKTIKIKVMYGL